MRIIRTCSTASAAILLWLSGASSGLSQGTSAFSYQGRLETNGVSATGNYEMIFRLYDAASSGSLRGGPVTINPVNVTNGFFTTAIDFGSAAFDGAALWLEMAVRPAGSAVSFTTLSPRQRLWPTPYAVFASRAADLKAGVSPVFSGTPAFAAPSGPPFTVSSSTLVQNLNADLLDGLEASAFVQRAGDTMTGSLAVAVSAGTAIKGDATNTAGGIGVLGEAGRPLILTWPFPLNIPSWGVMGRAQHTNSGGVFGEALTQTGPTWGVRGRAQSPSGYGVAGENTVGGGIAVYGLQGAGAGSTTVNSGVYGESTILNGNGVVGVADDGTSAYGVWGRSSQGRGGVFSGGSYGIHASSSAGVAGYFRGNVQVSLDSTLARPHLRLHEDQDGDYARLEFQAASRPLWHIAVGGGAVNQMNFYNSANGDVMTLKQDGTLMVRVLTITGGADLAEPFEMPADIPKGAVVVIDDENPGRLKLSECAYDTRVAGVVSGANGVSPGLTLSQQGVLEGGQHVALTGRVYVQADAASGAIKPGDLLTTSERPGHAMKVQEPARAPGAVLGKAMSGLKEGQGLVLVLVTLQ